jgi:hypothetical protein
VRAYRILLDHTPRPSEPPAAGSATATLGLPDKPSIAVLPFANMSNEPEQDFFADGIAGVAPRRARLCGESDPMPASTATNTGQ